MPQELIHPKTGEVIEADDSANIPALIEMAAKKLATIKSCAEAMATADLARLARKLAAISHSAHEVQGDCLIIECLAEVEAAVQLKTAQQRGEVATQAEGPKRRGAKKESRVTGKLQAATLKELGIDSRRLSDWRLMADAGENVIRLAVDDDIAKSKAPTKRGVMRAVKEAVGVKPATRGKPHLTIVPPKEEVTTELVGRVIHWMRNGIRLQEAFGSGHEYARQAVAAGVRIDHADLDVIQNFVAEMIEATEAVRAA